MYFFDRNISTRIARSIKYRLYEEFYNHNAITPKVALQIVGSCVNGKYIKNPDSFKSLADEISARYFKFNLKENNKNSIKEFIDEKELKSLIENTIMQSV